MRTKNLVAAFCNPLGSGDGSDRCGTSFIAEFSFRIIGTSPTAIPGTVSVATGPAARLCIAGPDAPGNRGRCRY
jgi:hypothetical protein